MEAKDREMEVVPLPVMAPETVMVWLPVKYVLVSTDNVPLPLIVLTKPLAVRLERAGMLVVAKVETPLTDNVPPTLKKFDMVVEPVTAKVLPPVNWKLEEVAKVLLPWPNKISLAVKFCS